MPIKRPAAKKPVAAKRARAVRRPAAPGLEVPVVFETLEQPVLTAVVPPEDFIGSAAEEYAPEVPSVDLASPFPAAPSFVYPASDTVEESLEEVVEAPEQLMEEVEPAEDLHALWAAREAHHTQVKTRTAMIVGVAMLAIVGIWGVNTAQGIHSVTVSAMQNGGESQNFWQAIQTYDQQLDAVTARTAPVPVAQEVQMPDTQAFVGALKDRVAAIAASPSPSPRPLK